MNNLKIKKIIQDDGGENVLDAEYVDIPGQKSKMRKLRDYYYETINRGKIFGFGEYTTRFLSGLNIQLFGFLGGECWLEDKLSETPFRDHLTASKSVFTCDLMRLARVVGQWRIQGDRITTNMLAGEDSSFRAKGKSLEFFLLLKELDGLYLRFPGISEYLYSG